uniref:Uncharacterized protein n=1 Tax=Trichuris muris TaxID=70415 RepID=A0A5S6QWZ8_TRIMR
MPKGNLLYRLIVSVEISSWPGQFSEDDFRTLVHTAINSVLGLVGSLKGVYIGDYDPNKQEGWIVIKEKDLNSVWAALCIYGSHFGYELAIRVRKVFAIEPCPRSVLLRCRPIKDFAGYHVLITGGSKARNAQALRRTADELRRTSKGGQKVFWYAEDLSENWHQISELVRRIEIEGGPVDVLINNVGGAVQAPLEDLKEEDFLNQIKLNYMTAACISKNVLISMKRNSSERLRHRRICFLSSQAGQIEALQMECRPHNVWITIAYPPHTDTEGFVEEWNLTPELTKQITAGETPPMKPADVARHIIDSVAKGEFNCHMGMEGWMLSTVCAGMSPVNNWLDVVVQAFAIGPLRLVGLFYLLKFNFTVSKK